MDIQAELTPGTFIKTKGARDVVGLRRIVTVDDDLKFISERKIK